MLDGKRPAWNRVECTEGFKAGLQMPVATALHKLELDQRKSECSDKRLTSAILKSTVVIKKKKITF